MYLFLVDMVINATFEWLIESDSCEYVYSIFQMFALIGVTAEVSYFMILAYGLDSFSLFLQIVRTHVHSQQAESQ